MNQEERDEDVAILRARVRAQVGPDEDIERYLTDQYDRAVRKESTLTDE